VITEILRWEVIDDEPDCMAYWAEVPLSKDPDDADARRGLLIYVSGAPDWRVEASLAENRHYDRDHFVAESEHHLTLTLADLQRLQMALRETEAKMIAVLNPA
jgi:hypothetical protein